MEPQLRAGRAAAQGCPEACTSTDDGFEPRLSSGVMAE